MLLSRNNWTRKRFNLFFYLHVQKIIEVFRYLNIGRLSIDIPHQKATVLLYFYANALFFCCLYILNYLHCKSFTDANTHAYAGIQILNGLLKFRAPSRISNINHLIAWFNTKYLYLIAYQLSLIVL